MEEEEEEDITPQQTEKLIQFQDLTGIDDMAQCKELLKNNNWDLEAAVQHHLVQQVRASFVKLFSDKNLIRNYIALNRASCFDFSLTPYLFFLGAHG